MFCSKCGANVAEGSAFCPNCGAPVAGAATPAAPSPAPPATPPGAPAAPSYAPPQYAAPAAPSYAPPPPTVAYAGFWLRVVAAIIDSLILGLPLIFCFFLAFADVMPHFRHNEDPFTFLTTLLPRVLALVIVFYIVSWVYWATAESSSWQGTLGKKALGLYVTDLNGMRTNFARTTGRFWAGRGLGLVPYVGGLYFMVSCICAGFTEKKQALHDMMAGCLVLRKL